MEIYLLKFINKKYIRPNKETSMFPVVWAHSILATKFAHWFFFCLFVFCFNKWSVYYEIINAEKGNTNTKKKKDPKKPTSKKVTWPEHAEHIRVMW